MSVDWTERVKTPYGELIFPKHDEWILRETKLTGYWELLLVSEIEKCLPKGGVMVDAGAFVGTHTIAAATKVGLEGKIFSFEPQRLIHQLLCFNVANNNLVNVKTFNAALGHDYRPRIWMSDTVVNDYKPTFPRESYKYFDLPETTHINYGGICLGENGDETYMISLDSLMPQFHRLDVIKADLQGCEPLFFWGAREIIKKFKPTIFYELDYTFHVDEAMRRTLTPTDEQAKFDYVTWLQSEAGYGKPVHLDPLNWRISPLEPSPTQ